MKIKAIGGCCRKAKLNYENAIEAAKICGIEEEVELVSEYAEIAALGVMATPALIINDKIVATGKMLKTKELVELIKKESK